jgi:signal peptidase II
MSDDETKLASHRTKWILFSAVTVLSLVADQASKIWARGSLGPSDCAAFEKTGTGVCHAVVHGYWDWQLSMNPGSAFGLFSGTSFARVLLSVVGIAAVIGMIVMLRKSRADQKILHWALALVAGGAIGNLIDRVRFGVVTDFIHWHLGTIATVKDKFGEHYSYAWNWPVFNVADIVLVIGVGLMFIDIQSENKRTGKKKTKAQREAAVERAKAAGLVKKL